MAQHKTTKSKSLHESKKHGHNNSISHNIHDKSDLMQASLKPSNQTYHNLR